MNKFLGDLTEHVKVLLELGITDKYCRKYNLSLSVLMPKM